MELSTMTAAIVISTTSEAAPSVDETELESAGPIDPGKRTIIWEPQTPSVFDLIYRCRNGRLDLKPKFQRHTVWNTQPVPRTRGDSREDVEGVVDAAAGSPHTRG